MQESQLFLGNHLWYHFYPLVLLPYVILIDDLSARGACDICSIPALSCLIHLLVYQSLWMLSIGFRVLSPSHFLPLLCVTMFDLIWMLCGYSSIP